jgi:hypothetical protein
LLFHRELARLKANGAIVTTSRKKSFSESVAFQVGTGPNKIIIGVSILR